MGYLQITQLCVLKYWYHQPWEQYHTSPHLDAKIWEHSQGLCYGPRQWSDTSADLSCCHSLRQYYVKRKLENSCEGMPLGGPFEEVENLKEANKNKLFFTTMAQCCSIAQKPCWLISHTLSCILSWILINQESREIWE